MTTIAHAGCAGTICIDTASPPENWKAVSRNVRMALIELIEDGYAVQIAFRHVIPGDLPDIDVAFDLPEVATSSRLAALDFRVRASIEPSDLMWS